MSLGLLTVRGDRHIPHLSLLKRPLLLSDPTVDLGLGKPGWEVGPDQGPWVALAHGALATVSPPHPYSFSQFSSVIQSCLTLRPHELQHARPPCPSPTP